MNGPVYLGIDPGVRGALGVVTGLGAAVHDVPVEVVKKGRTNRRLYLSREMFEMLQRIKVEAGDEPVVAAIEDVNANPTFSAVANFALGRGVALWEMALIAAGIPFERARPSRWKKAMGIAAGSSKNASRLVAQELYPDLYSRLKRADDHNRAEALLIGTWRSRQ